jgi:hypothetical protein
VHASYVLVLIYYINYVYVEHNGLIYDEQLREWVDDPEHPTDPYYQYYQAICLAYPLFFEIFRCQKLGLSYFSNMGSLLDVAHIFFGFLNIYF